jgi:hypothetical protein
MTGSVVTFNGVVMVQDSDEADKYLYGRDLDYGSSLVCWSTEDEEGDSHLEFRGFIQDVEGDPMYFDASDGEGAVLLTFTFGKRGWSYIMVNMQIIHIMRTMELKVRRTCEKWRKANPLEGATACATPTSTPTVE